METILPMATMLGLRNMISTVTLPSMETSHRLQAPVVDPIHPRLLHRQALPAVMRERLKKMRTPVLPAFQVTKVTVRQKAHSNSRCTPIQTQIRLKTAYAKLTRMPSPTPASQKPGARVWLRDGWP
jgi:hypothetical protein